MSEIARALGSAGAGFPLTLIPPDELEVQDEIDTLIVSLKVQQEKTPASNPSDPEDPITKMETELQSLKSELEDLQKRDRVVLRFNRINLAMEGKLEEFLIEKARDTAIKTTRRIRREIKEIQLRLADVGMSDEDRQSYSIEGFALKEAADNHFAEMDSRIVGCEYSFTESICQMWLNSKEGLSKLALIMLQSHHPDMTEEDISILITDHQRQIMDKIREVNHMGKYKRRKRETTTKND